MSKIKTFFGAEVTSPWKELPKQGREISTSMRHITLAFWGVTENTPSLKPLSFSIAPTGIFDRLLFLPEGHPRVVAYHAHFLSKEKEVLALQKTLIPGPEKMPFVPHVTIMRDSHPDRILWQKLFSPLPFFVRAIHLYESLENLRYIPLCSQPLIPPFEPKEHTADLAFTVRGSQVHELYTHAVLALAFTFPPILLHIEKHPNFTSFEEIVKGLNRLITKVDIEIGCPFKAVCLQGDIQEKAGPTYEWEMIVDV